MSEETLRTAAKGFRNLPIPRNDEELSVLAELCFGRPCRMERVSQYGYKAEPSFDEMFSQDFLKFHSVATYSTHLYDYARQFWKRNIGPLTCGGIARSSYGQFSIAGHRQKTRISYWEQSRRGKRGSSLRPTFVRLARQLRDGKNREIRGIPVLTSGRADGADAVS